MPVTGRIADVARDTIPVTWAALENDNRYGTPALQRRVDYVKSSLFGRLITDVEEDLLDPLVVEYAGKLVAIALIKPGTEYWAVQKLVDSSGERHQGTWVDRVEKLWQLHKDLVAEARAMLPDVEEILGPDIRVTRRRPRIGVSDGTSEKMVTQDPFTFERTFLVPESTDLTEIG